MSDTVVELSEVRAGAAARRRTYQDGNGNPCTARELVQWRLELDVQRVIKYGADDAAEHDLVLDNGRKVNIGTSHDVLDQKKVRGVILGAIPGHVVKRCKPHEWEDVASALTSPEWLEAIDTGAGTDTETRTWLREYVGRGVSQPVSLDDRDELAATLRDDWRSRAFRGDDGRLYLHLPTLVQFIGVHYRQRLTTAQITARLSRLGFAKRRETAQGSRGKQERRMLWHSPPDFDLDDDVSTDAPL